MGSAVQPKAFVQLTRLQKVSSLLVRAQTTKEIARIIVDEGFRAMDAISGDLILLSEDKTHYDLLAFRGYPENFLNNFPHLSLKTPLLTNEVIASKKPFFLESAKDLDNKYQHAKKYLLLSHSNAAAIFPLKIQNNVIGILQFTFKDAHEFSLENKRFMYALSDQCSNALDRALALEHVRQSKEELEVILESVADAVTVRDSEGTIMYVNDASCRLHHCSPSELIGKTHDEYKNFYGRVENEHGQLVENDELPSHKIYKGAKYAEGIFKETLKKSGHTQWVKIKSVGIYGKDKKLQFVVNVSQDITTEKQADSLKDEFISIASHELKTPITSLKAFAQVLQHKFTKEKNNEAAELLQKMNYQIDRLTTLVVDLLDITKIEGGKLALHEEPINIDTLTREFVEEMQRITTSHEILLQGHTKSIICADKERLGQVMTNLLTNAVKYSPESKKVIVRLKKDAQNIVISVQDFGIGIPKDKQNHIFKRFYRETGFKENTFPGLGLGLYITSEIIKRQKGKIWVESKKGKGSTFSFSLPICDDH